ncbi:hypothetical protein [Armatimonas rosea]|uniref:Uncharacterized protein n=1 Tax=Armatimonas rosea TaxID=685828 RepID=A0A7W9SMC8_ARMRO|nr:hypothetical protein [Armatimonas rosea]MBB6048834.1 hypothetical protein [Armatimonas rosea]
MKTSLLKDKSTTSFGFIASLVLLGICTTVSLANPQIVFSDSNFSQSQYVSGMSINFGNGGVGSTIFGTGKVTISSTVTPGSASYSGHSDIIMCKWAKYTPSNQGAISTISWKQTVSCNEAQGQSGAVLFIFQGGKYFRSLVPVNVGSNGLVISKTGLTSNNFDEVVSGMPSASAPQGINFNSHPDFTSSGATMQFGIGAGKSAGQGAPGSKASARLIVDDWEVKVVPQ